MYGLYIVKSLNQFYEIYLHNDVKSVLHVKKSLFRIKIYIDMLIRYNINAINAISYKK